MHLVLLLEEDIVFDVFVPVYSKMTLKILCSNINRPATLHHRFRENPVSPYPAYLGGSNNVLSKHIYIS